MATFEGREIEAPALFGGWTDRVPARADASRLLAYIANEGRVATRILDHAENLARGLDLPFSIGHVIETPLHGESPTDPVEWESLVGTHEAGLGSVARRRRKQVPTLMLTGSPALELSNWALRHAPVLIVLARHDTVGLTDGLGPTAKALLDNRSASLLLVPEGCRAESIRRILVPLDGSIRAESVLPVAIRIARAHGAEIVLAQVVTDCGDTARGERAMFGSRVDCAAIARSRDYLERLRKRLWREFVPARGLLIDDGEATAELCATAVRQQADLIILSSHGESGNGDVPYGSVTGHLAANAAVPTLVVRPNFAQLLSGSTGLVGATSKSQPEVDR